MLIGETANKGTPKSWEKKGPDGRSLPRPWDDPKGNGSSFPIRGFEFYDGKVGVRNTAFVNFSENTVRKASALSTLRFTDFDISARNFAEGLSFENALPLYLENAPEPTVNASNEGHDGYRSSVFTDVDGSVTGTPNRVVVVNNPFLVDANCTLNTTWNAHVCDNAYARFYVDNVDANPADLAPVSLTRDTLTHKMWGAPYGNPNKNFQGTLIANRAYTIGMNNSSNHLRLHFRNRAAGEWVRVSLPWTGTVFTYRDWWIDARNTLAAASSLADLEASTGNKYWLEGGTLHLKMQIQANADNRDWAVLDVCKTALCK